jgi:hypothetical protein
MQASRSHGRVLDSLMEQKQLGHLPGIFGRLVSGEHWHRGLLLLMNMASRTGTASMLRVILGKYVHEVMLLCVYYREI